MLLADRGSTAALLAVLLLLLGGSVREGSATIQEVVVPNVKSTKFFNVFPLNKLIQSISIHTINSINQRYV